MPSPFVSVTTIALEEILTKHLEPSKFGYFLSEIEKKHLIDELVHFVETSRNLKSRGDKLLESAPSGKREPRR